MHSAPITTGSPYRIIRHLPAGKHTADIWDENRGWIGEYVVVVRVVAGVVQKVEANQTGSRLASCTGASRIYADAVGRDSLRYS